MPKGNAPLCALDAPGLKRHKGGIMCTFYGREVQASLAIARDFHVRLGKLLDEADRENATRIAPICKGCEGKH